MYELLHAGFDTLDIAIQGSLPADQLAKLRQAREQAAARQEPVLTRIGQGEVPMHVAGHGLRGGYAFVADTGPLGAQWRFKDSADPRSWNVFVSPHATMLLAYGYPCAWERLRQAFRAMGGELADHSLNRVDFAMDVRTSGFELHADQFVTHARSKVQTYWGDTSVRKRCDQPAAVFRGRRLESVTVGKQPGRQIIVYDKRREALERQKLFWFKAWGVDRDDPALDVWRVEVRAGKSELKDKYGIRRVDDFEDGIGDVVMHALQDVRYLADAQEDSNVTRHKLHPLWQRCIETAQTSLFTFRSGLTPGQVIQIERAVACDRYRSLIIGNAVGLAVSLGLDPDDILGELSRIGAEAIDA
jgi:hypothetical protein